MGRNFFVWIGIAVIAASTVASSQGFGWALWVGYPTGIALAVFNKIRAVRRGRREASETFD
jgi:hypothetical protein